MPTNFITPNMFINSRINKLHKSVRAHANDYTFHARAHGVRICNDGYPDARYKATYLREFEAIRQLIADLRREYEYHFNNTQVVYKPVSPEVAEGYLNKIKSMFK